MVTKKDDDQQNTSLLVIQVLVFLLVNFILWGIAAGIYNGGSGLGSARRSGGNILIFIASSVATLPEIGSVIPYIWSNHMWYVGVFVVVEILLVLFILWMKKVDDDLKGGNPFRKR